MHKTTALLWSKQYSHFHQCIVIIAHLNSIKFAIHLWQMKRFIANHYQKIVSFCILVTLFSLLVFPYIFSFSGSTERSSQDNRKPENIRWNYSQPRGWGGDVWTLFHLLNASHFEPNLELICLKSRWLLTKEPMSSLLTSIGWQILKFSSPLRTGPEEWVQFTVHSL